MDAFEEIVSGLLQHQGYWVRPGYKVTLSLEEKRKLGKPSLPRPEIDILAYGPSADELLWVECKSLLDSVGVRMQHFNPQYRRAPGHYYVFNDPLYRRIVTRRLLKQMWAQSLYKTRPRVVYCLAAGHIATDKDRERIRKMFRRNGWRLFDDGWVKQELAKLADSSYENDVTAMVAKLIVRSGGR